MAAVVAPNSTYGNAVYRGDGVRLFGMDAEIEVKMRAKRDPQLEKELGQWIEKATGEKLKFPDDLIESLKSGIILCKLINTLLPGTIKSVNTRDTALHHMENIGLYLKACWKVGVESSDLFVAADLYLKKGIPAVIQNLLAIARCSHYCEQYKGPTFGYKPQNVAPAKKWDEIKFTGPVFVTDVENNNSNNNANNSNNSSSCFKCGNEKICQLCNPPPSKPINIINEKEKEREKEKEKEFLLKIQQLSNQLKEKEESFKSLNNDFEKQKKKFIDDEKQLKDTINNQKSQIESKENIIESLNKTNSNLILLAQSNNNNNNNSNITNSNTKANSYITPSTSNSSTASTTNIGSTATTTSSSTNKSNRNSGVFQAVSAINNKTTTTPTSSTLNATATVIKCTRCNSTTNKPTQKYCSCGELLKKDTTSPPSSTFNKPPISFTATPSYVTPSNNTTNTTPSYLSNRTSVNITSNNTTSTSSTTQSINNNEVDKLNEKIKTLCLTMKQQEETISKLNNQINSDKQLFEKEKKQQKQIIDNQQILLNQKEQDLKKVQSTISSNSSSSTTATNNSNNNKPYLLGAELKSINNNNNNNKSTTNDSSSIYSKPYNGNSNITVPPNSTIISNKELELLKEKLNELEFKLNDEITKSKAKDSTISLLNEKVSSFNNRPKRVLQGAAGATKTSQVVVGKKRFNTLKPDSQDITSLLDATLSHLSAILYNKPIEFYQVTSLKDLFNTETGRRRFTQILSSTLKSVPQLQLTETSFEFLLYLISCALQEMNLAQDHDFQCARIIFHCSDSVYRINTTNGQAEFLKSYIVSSPIYRELRFWSDHYWSELSKRHRKVYGKIPDQLDRDIISNLLSYFGANMIYFSIDSTAVKDFINEIGSQHNLDKKHIEMIISTLKESPLYQSINTNNNNNTNNKSSKVTSSAKVIKKDKDDKKKK